MQYQLGSLTNLQRSIYESYRLGESVDLSNRPDDDCTVDGAFLAFLLLGGLEIHPGSRPSLDLRGARVHGPLTLEGATIDAIVSFVECCFDDEIVLRHARVPRFSLRACQVRGVSASGATVDGDLELFGGTLCWGTVDLEGATVHGTLRLSRATVHAPDGGRSLLLSRAQIDGSALLAESVLVGQVRMISCRVDGLLSFRRARVESSVGSAIEAERAVVGESLFFQRGFVATSNVAFDNSRIGGGVDCTGSSFAHGSTDRCLNLGRARVERNISLKDAIFDGDVRMFGTEARGSVRFVGSTFAGDKERTLDLDYSRSSRLQFEFAERPSQVTLRYATHDVVDDTPTCWPSSVALKGLVYKSLEGGKDFDVRARLAWLRSDIDGFTPQPYEQLAVAFRSAGDDGAARTVALRKQRVRRREQSRVSRIPGLIVDGLVGYGYRNWYAVFWLLAILAAGTCLFYLYPPIPVPAAAGRSSSPILLALDLTLPVVDIGEEKNWVATAPIRWLPAALVLSGWILTTAVVAGLARILNRPT